MRADTVLRLYRVCFVALLTAASVQTALLGHAGGHAVVALALAEIAGALALLWPRTQIAGAGILLAVFALAQVLSARSGHWPTQFLQYAASTLLILLMGRALRTPVAAPPDAQRHGPAGRSRRIGYTRSGLKRASIQE